jgi:very-short-patch-repair endonuclease
MIYLGYLLLRFQDEEVFNEIETLRLEILKVST